MLAVPLAAKKTPVCMSPKPDELASPTLPSDGVPEKNSTVPPGPSAALLVCSVAVKVTLVWSPTLLALDATVVVVEPLVTVKLAGTEELLALKLLSLPY